MNEYDICASSSFLNSLKLILSLHGSIFPSPTRTKQMIDYLFKELLSGMIKF